MRSFSWPNKSLTSFTFASLSAMVVVAVLEGIEASSSSYQGDVLESGCKIFNTTAD